jgi:Cu(I)/Ag(I) efflux system membrane fusion protein
MNTRKQILISAALLGVALATAGLYGALASPRDGGEDEGHDQVSGQTAADGEARPIELTVEAARRIGVTYATAALKPFRREARLVGSVTYDETRVVIVTPKFEGWIERLYVDFTGAPVRRGQPLMDVYSPMLVAAQEELILAGRLAADAGTGGSDRARSSAAELLDAARMRLLHWDVSPMQIAAIERSGRPRRTLTLHAPSSGIVVEKTALEGSRVMPGMELFRIADLSRVWIDGEVFEKDLSLIRLGQRALVTFEAYPGEEFEAVVSYVHPSVSMESRTGRVRLELPNPGLRIMPGMYAQVTLHSDGVREALLIPRSAVHDTGTRSLVFVRHDGTLTPREVVTGLVAGDEIEILSGIDPGMEVVASANFLVDAESNMGASMGAMPGMDMGAPPAPSGSRDTTSDMDMSGSPPTARPSSPDGGAQPDVGGGHDH